MRAKTLSILSLLLFTGLLVGCSGSSGSGQTETFTLRDKKVSFKAPPASWKRSEHKTEPSQDATFDKPQLLAVEFTPPSGGHLTVTNLGVSDLVRKGKELRSIAEVLGQNPKAPDAMNRIVTELDESGLAGLIEYYDEESKAVKSLENPLHDQLDQAARALKAGKTQDAISFLNKAAELCEEGSKKTEVDLIETGRVFWAIKKREGKITAQEEIKVDGQRAAWIAFTVGDERGLSVLFMKDKNLFSVSLNTPSAGYAEGEAAVKTLVDSLKVE
jgi:hypothetical protein